MNILIINLNMICRTYIPPSRIGCHLKTDYIFTIIIQHSPLRLFTSYALVCSAVLML